MDCNIERAQSLLTSGKATKEELEKVLKDIVDNYSTRPRIVIYLDDYNMSREDIINAVVPVCDCKYGYDPDFYTCCMEERNRFESLVEDLENYASRVDDEDEDKEYIKKEMQRIVGVLENDFNADYAYYLDCFENE